MAEPQTVVAEPPAQGAQPPETGAPQEPTGSQEGEPTQAGKATSPANDLRSLQARLSQQGMALGAIRDKLGLPKSIPDHEIAAALDAALTRKPAVVTDDPVLQAEWERLNEQRWSWVERTYGADAANAVRHIRDLVLTTDDPEAMASAFWAAREASGMTPPASASTAAAPQEQPPPEAPPQEQPPDLEMGESARNDLGARPIPPSITEGLKGSGNLREAARRIFRGSARA